MMHVLEQNVKVSSKNVADLIFLINQKLIFKTPGRKFFGNGSKVLIISRFYDYKLNSSISIDS